MNRIFNISKEEAIHDLASGLTYVDIAKKIGCSRMVAYRRMKEMGIIENQDKAMNKLRWHEQLTEKQTKFFLGCLLGDGNITSSGMFQCNHSNKQLEYIEYKKEILSSLLAPNFKLIFNTIKNHQNGKIYYSYYLRTMSNEYIKEIYGNYYVDKVKIFPYEYLVNSSFDEYSLAIWYMDDGSRSANTPSLYTYAFGYNGNLDILKFLKNKFDLRADIKEDSGKNRSIDAVNFISFCEKSDKDKFFQLVSPHILPCFQYKLPEKYRTIHA